MKSTRLGCTTIVAVSLLLPWSLKAADDQASTVSKPPARRMVTTRPTTRPMRHSATRGQLPASLNAAIQALRQEYADGKLRDTSSYFQDKPNAELTNDAVVMALGRRLPGMAGPEEAYVKWQLLSAMPKEIPSQYEADAVAAYRNAPQFDLRPGMRADQKRQLDRELRKASDPEAVSRRLNEDVAQVKTADRPLAAYRDELLARLPDSYDLFDVAIQDLYERAEAGADVGKVGDDVMRRIRTWAETANSARDLQGINSLLDQMRVFRAPTYYDGFHFDRDAGGNKWDERAADLDRDRRIEQTQDAISTRQSTLGAGQGAQSSRNTRTHDRKRNRVEQTP